MNKLTIMKNIVTRSVARYGIQVKKYSPEILIGLGIVGVVTSTVLACKATLKVDAIVDKAQKDIKRIKDPAIPCKENYTKTDEQKDLAIVYVQSGVKMVKLYVPAVLVGVVSVACLLGAHNIMRQRNIALVAAYKAIEGGFKDYRRRVVDEFGSDKDREFKTGIRRESITEIEKDEHGKSKKVTKIVEHIDPNQYSTYARFFDESSPNWSKTPEYNMIFLKCQQNYCNDLLQSRGHVFLNEVYRLIGIPHSQAGAIVGWVLGENNDNYIDFGMYDMDNTAVRDFVNGYERNILLDFNVDGVIYNKI